MNAKERRYVASLETRISILETERKSYYDEWRDRCLDSIDMTHAIRDVATLLEETRNRIEQISRLWKEHDSR